MTTILWGNHGVVLIDYPEKDKSFTEAYYAPLIHIKIKISKIKITKANVAIAEKILFHESSPTCLPIVLICQATFFIPKLKICFWRNQKLQHIQRLRLERPGGSRAQSLLRMDFYLFFLFVIKSEKCYNIPNANVQIFLQTRFFKMTFFIFPRILTQKLMNRSL